MKACVINGLKTCSDPTPANVVEGLIDSMIKKTPCFKSEANYLNTSQSCPSALLLAMLAMATRFMFQS